MYGPGPLSILLLFRKLLLCHAKEKQKDELVSGDIYRKACSWKPVLSLACSSLCDVGEPSLWPDSHIKKKYI